MIKFQTKRLENRKKISVVLPVYNGASTLGRAIESVLNQSYSNFELIIVNDCSTDDSLAIAESYCKKDERIVLLNNETNLKLPMSLNAGFKAASGDFLTWTSDDNTYKSDAFSVMADFLENNKYFDLVYCDFDSITSDGTLINTNFLPEPEQLKFGNVIGACFLYRKSLADIVGEYDNALFLAEDFDFWVRCYLEGRLYHLSENLYNYGIHEKSLTATRAREILEVTYAVLNKHFEALYKRCNTDGDRNKFLMNILELKKCSAEYNELKLHFFSVNPNFRKYYKKIIVKRLLKKIFNLTSKVVNKVANLFQ